MVEIYNDERFSVSDEEDEMSTFDEKLREKRREEESSPLPLAEEGRLRGNMTEVGREEGPPGYQALIDYRPD